jgi:hypothetical protein
MKNCKDIKNILPLYLDNLLSDADKRAVEEHLKSCPRCGKALAQLQKTGKLVDSLAEVEPPPWFKQKIMAKVREESKKKNFAQKWFYPLRIKIPIQVFATIFIVVLAVYIYRAGNEQFKEVIPSQAPTPVMEAEKDKLSEQTTKLPEADKTVVKKKVSVKKGIRDEETVMYDVSPGSGTPKTEELKKAIPQENVLAGTADMAKAMKRDAAVDKKETNYAALSEKQAEPAKSMPPSRLELERKKEGYVLGASMKQSRAPEAQSVMPKTTISVRVGDLNIAVGEVEKLLIKYEAKKIVKQMPEDKATFAAELKVKNIKDLIAQLKIIGRVEEKGIPTDDGSDRDISVAIEILSP